MTIVVSEVGGFGIAMVADSAVTVRHPAPIKVYEGAAKVQYSDVANVGFAMWGNACVDGVAMDAWLESFIAKRIQSGDSMPVIADRLAVEMNLQLRATGRPWAELRRGIHIAGYVDDLPCLYHIHTGGDLAAQHELRVHKDFPDGLKISPGKYAHDLKVGMYHLRNGYFEVYGALFDSLYPFTTALQKLKFGWPFNSLEHRVSLHKLLVKFVADALIADEQLPAVGGPLQGIGFTETGLKIDQRLSTTPNLYPCGTMAEF